MTRQAIRVGIIGTGRISDLHAIEYIQNPFSQITALCDQDLDLARFRAAKWGCPDAAVTKNYNFAWLEKKKKKFIPINFDPKIITKTQNLNPIIQSNGAFFIFKKKTFMKYNNRIGKKPFYYEINYPEALEIDTYDDLYLARKICK